MHASRKSPILVIVPIGIMVVVTWFIILPWVYRVDLMNPYLSVAAHANALIWVVVLWWSIHQLTFQIAALFQPNSVCTGTEKVTEVPLVVLYMTCDDFQLEACESCLSQDYPRENYRLVICDDSQTMEQRLRIDAFEKSHREITVLRRADRTGYKAGNLNHALGSLRPSEEWAIILDADQILPKMYLSQIASAICMQPDDVAYIQAGHEPDHLATKGIGTEPNRGSTAFQQLLGLEVQIFYERDLTLREKFGFLPCIGHGVAVRVSAWRDVGGFPEVVSEDYAFAMATRLNGWRGVHTDWIRSWEAFPQDFGTFVVRLGKFAGGSAELLRSTVFRRFLLSRSISVTEKIDIAMGLLWYPLMLLVLCNVFLSAYVCHRSWQLQLPFVHPVLPYLFLSMFLLIWPVLLSVTKSLPPAIGYWFWASAVYAASMPVAAWRFFVHLWKLPTFNRTPKGSTRTHPSYAVCALLILIGMSAVVLSRWWWSPFSPVLTGYGIAFLSYPSYHFLNGKGLAGRIHRSLIYVPGLFLIWALRTMWLWGTL